MSRTTLAPTGARTTARGLLALTVAVAATSVISNSASAAFVTLNSPDLRYNIRASEFGNFGPAWTGGIARGNFGDGNGLQDFVTASSLMLSRNGTSQWLTNTVLVADASPIGGTHMTNAPTSDTTVGNVRNTSFTVPGFSNLNVQLRQEAANDGFHQTYTFTNTSTANTSLTLVDAADFDVPFSNALANRLDVISPSRLAVFDGSSFQRTAYRYADRNYNAFAAIHHPDGVTGRMFMAAYNADAIPASGVNAFRTLSEDFDFPALIGNNDINGDQISDSFLDIGFHMQYNLVLAPNQPQSIMITTLISNVPEPTTLGALGATALLTLRRRRR